MAGGLDKLTNRMPPVDISRPLIGVEFRMIRNIRDKRIMFGCSVFLFVCFLTLAFPGRYVLRLTYDHYKRNQWVNRTHDDLDHYPYSTMLFTGNREDSNKPSTPTCGVIIRIGFWGTDDVFSTIKEHYEKLFTNLGWTAGSDYSDWFSFDVDSYSRVEIHRVDTLPEGVSLSPDEFESIRRQYETVYSTEVVSWSSVACPH